MPVWVDEIPPAAKAEEKEDGSKEEGAEEKEAEEVETLQTWITSYLSPTASPTEKYAELVGVTL